MRSKLSCPFGTNFYPLSRQLGVGKSKARSRPRVISRCRQRNLQDYELAEQDDVNAEFVAETLKDAEPIHPAVPLIQPMFQQGVQGMLYLVAVTFYARQRDIRIRLFRLVLLVIRENLFNRDLSIGSNSQ